MSDRVVVTSAAGAQGQAIVRAMVAAGHQVVGLARSAAGAATVEALGATALVCDLVQTDRLAEALAGARAVVFTPPVDYRPGVRQQLAASLADAADAAGVERIVLNTGAHPFAGSPRPVSATLAAVRAALDRGRTPTVTLAPTIYMENLLGPWTRSQLLDEGVLAYPVAPEAAVAWVSHRTLGEACVAALGARAQPGGVYRAGGPSALTLDDLAQGLADVIGGPVRAVPLACDAFADRLAAVIGPEAAEGVAGYYRDLEAAPDALASSDLPVLGVEAELFAAWAARQDWRPAQEA